MRLLPSRFDQCGMDDDGHDDVLCSIRKYTLSPRSILPNQAISTLSIQDRSIILIMFYFYTVGLYGTLPNDSGMRQHLLRYYHRYGKPKA